MHANTNCVLHVCSTEIIVIYNFLCSATLTWWSTQYGSILLTSGFLDWHFSLLVTSRSGKSLHLITRWAATVIIPMDPFLGCVVFVDRRNALDTLISYRWCTLTRMFWLCIYPGFIHHMNTPSQCIILYHQYHGMYFINILYIRIIMMITQDCMSHTI